MASCSSRTQTNAVSPLFVRSQLSTSGRRDDLLGENIGTTWRSFCVSKCVPLPPLPLSDVPLGASRCRASPDADALQPVQLHPSAARTSSLPDILDSAAIRSPNGAFCFRVDMCRPSARGKRCVLLPQFSISGGSASSRSEFVRGLLHEVAADALPASRAQQSMPTLVVFSPSTPAKAAASLYVPLLPSSPLPRSPISIEPG